MTGLQQNNGSQLSANSGAIVVNGNAQFNNGSQVDGGGGTLTVSGTATANSGSDVWGWPAGNCSNCNFSSSVQPIKLLKFSAVYSASKVNLEWITVTETNNRFFTIEKSTDGVNFSYFKDVRSKAPNGNSLTKLHYTLIDENPFSGISYYRLKQTDYNGDHEYFNIVSVFSKSTKEISFSVLPNPNNGKFTAVFTGIENNGVASISVADIVGKLVYEKDLMAENGINALDIIPANTLGKGIYFCTLISAGQKHTVKVVVN